MHWLKDEANCKLCGVPHAGSKEEDIGRIKKQADKGNAKAIHLLVVEYSREGNMPKQPQTTRR